MNTRRLKLTLVLLTLVAGVAAFAAQAGGALTCAPAPSRLYV